MRDAIGLRDRYLSNELPALLSQWDTTGPELQRLTLFLLIKNNASLQHILRNRKLTDTEIYEEVWNLPDDQILETLSQFTTVEISNGAVDPKVKLKVGIDFMLDWSKFKIDQPFLEKMTKTELIELIGEFGMMRIDDFWVYIRTHYNTNRYERLKKSQIIDVILSCGFPLTGKIPKDVMAPVSSM